MYSDCLITSRSHMDVFRLFQRTNGCIQIFFTNRSPRGVFRLFYHTDHTWMYSSCSNTPTILHCAHLFGKLSLTIRCNLFDPIKSRFKGMYSDYLINRALRDVFGLPNQSAITHGCIQVILTHRSQRDAFRFS